MSVGSSEDTLASFSASPESSLVLSQVRALRTEVQQLTRSFRHSVLLVVQKKAEVQRMKQSIALLETNVQQLRDRSLPSHCCQLTCGLF